MHLTKRLLATGVVLLTCAGVAVAATSSPSGQYSGDVHWNNPGVGKQKFKVTATLKDGKLTDPTRTRPPIRPGTAET
jgi:major membrane immunogen (membrane-anchored lipoprotein)